MSHSESLVDIVIRASAGTGKTFQLSNRFIKLLHRGALVERILASTFTRKAAAEILDRIVVRLAESAGDRDECAKLSQFVDSATMSPNLTPRRCLEMLRQVLSQLHRLQVGTLDSFFGQVAGSLSLEMGLPTGWRIVDEIEDARMRDVAIGHMLRSQSGAEMARILHLMAKGEIRRSVAEQLRQTVDNLYNVYLESDKDAWFKIPRPPLLSGDERNDLLDELESLDLPQDKRFVSARKADIGRFLQEDWSNFLDKGLCGKSRGDAPVYYGKPIPGDVIAVYQKLSKHARAMLLHELAGQTEATYEMIHRFDQCFQQLKFDAGTVRFEDITRRLVDYVSQDALPRLEYRLDRRIQHILLDEFQDTSPVQWHVLRPFAHRSVQSAEGGTVVENSQGVTSLEEQKRLLDPSFFCVGDGKQAIYGWRGGAAEILAAIDAELPRLDQLDLNESHRSAPPIIDAVNQVFKGLARHGNLEKHQETIQAWSEDFPPHTTAKHALDGYVVLQTGPPVDDAEDSKIFHMRYAAEQIAHLVDSHPGNTVGVLVRTNDKVAQLIFELRQLGVPASEEGGNPLADSAAVQTILSLLRFADHPHHSVSQTHVSRSPLRDLIGKPLPNDSRGRESLANDLRRQLVDGGYGPAVRQWAEMLFPHAGERDRRRLQQLVALSYAYEPRATLRPSDFVHHVEQHRVSDPVTTDVRVMTVHQAKGLQFDTVVLPDLEYDIPGRTPSYVAGRPGPLDAIDSVCIYRNQTIQGLLPASLQQTFEIARRQEVEECLCLLYVALTRPVHALHMIISPSDAKETKLRRCASHLLRAALTAGAPAPPETVLYETGNRDWCSVQRNVDKSQGQSRETAAEPIGVGKRPKHSIPLAPTSSQQRTGKNRVFPSQLQGTSDVTLGSFFQWQKSDALHRGTLMHAWLEQIGWYEDGFPNEEELRRIAAPLELGSLRLDRELTAFQRALEQPAIQEFLSRSHYMDAAIGVTQVKVYREQAIAAHVNDELVMGTIDRLVVSQRGNQVVAAEVLDFKTDRLPESAVDESVITIAERYLPQVSAYCDAVCRAFRLEASVVRGQLVFLTAGSVVPVTTGMVVEELTER